MNFTSKLVSGFLLFLRFRIFLKKAVTFEQVNLGPVKRWIVISFAIHFAKYLIHARTALGTKLTMENCNASVIGVELFNVLKIW